MKCDPCLQYILLSFCYKVLRLLVGSCWSQFRTWLLLFKNFFIVLHTSGPALFCRVYNKDKHPHSFFSSKYYFENPSLQIFKTCRISGSRYQIERWGSIVPCSISFLNLGIYCLLPSSQPDAKTITTCLMH